MIKQKLPKGFSAFIVTESLGAWNDNFFKMLIQLYAVTILALADKEELISRAALVFTIPFVIFGPWAGYLADRFSKTRVMQFVKAFEIVIMMVGVAAFYYQDINALIAVLFLMASQSAFFAPAKAGFIPESCHEELITKANGIMGMTTFFAIIIGTALGGVFLVVLDNDILITSSIAVWIAAAGFISSFFITPTKPAGIPAKFPYNFVWGIVKDLMHIAKDKWLFLAALANSYFWLLALVFQTNIMVYATHHLGLTKEDNNLISILPAVMGVGIAMGALLASRWSGRKIEIGLVPLGAMGLTLTGILLYYSSSSYLFTSLVLVFGGVAGGLFIIPLNAFLQFDADDHEKGRIISTVGIMNGLFLVLGSLLYHLFAVMLQFTPAQIGLIMGGLTFLVTLYICYMVPEYLLRFIGWLLTHTFYKIKIEGRENVPFHGGALLVPNHVSFIDALLVGATVQRFIKFIMFHEIYEIPVVKQIAKIMEAIPINPEGGRNSIMKSLITAREKISSGEIVCIFPEGEITRTGELNEFKRGIEIIMKGVDSPVIPVYLHNVWGSVFSYDGGKFFWKMPRRFPYPVTIHYGKPLPASATAQEVEQAVKEIADLYKDHV